MNGAAAGHPSPHLGARIWALSRRALRIVLPAVMFATGATQPAAAYDVMLDVSGSMAGFAEFPVWTRLLNTLDTDAERKWVFGEDTQRFEAPLSEAELRDNETRLGSALRTWLTTARPGDTLDRKSVV